MCMSNGSATGAWTGAAPTCTIEDCGALTAPTNGSVAATVTTYGASATYACNTGYGASGSLTRTCGTGSAWSGAAPTCAIKNCGALTGPTNGSVSAPTTTYGATATYSCNTGFNVVGTATRTCLDTGTWGGSAATCAPKDCGTLTAPANGSVSAPTTTYGATATYSCVTGYGASGSSTRTCLDTGLWSGTAPSCVIANCPALQSPTGGSVSAPALTYGSTATYSCNNGYVLDGVATRMCQASMAWTGAAPTCDPKDCGPPPVPTHGTVSAPVTTLGAMATDACNTGYTLSGAVMRTCQSDQTWSATVPTCVPVDCGGLSVANGSVTYSAGTTFGSAASYSCNTNYQLSGTSPVTCLASGAWSSTPTCVDICSVAGNNGTSSHCCNNTPCPSSAPVCNTSTHACVQEGLGVGCTSASQCASGFCAFGVCCSEQCPGNSGCNTACTGGSCVHVTAQSRLGCGTRSLGQPGMNDVALICDGKGNCAGPKVPCGVSNTSCDLTVKACCQDSPSSDSGVDVACVVPSSCCNGSTTCGGATDQRWFGCKSNLDCPTGKMCCANVDYFGNYGYIYAACMTSCAYPWGGLMCDTNRSVTAQCPSGTTCNADTNDNDYATCY